jgi:hypothetical protein
MNWICDSGKKTCIHSYDGKTCFRAATWKIKSEVSCSLQLVSYCYWMPMSVCKVLRHVGVFQQKEPEYTKVRRKGGRLRDPHSESQGTVI